MINSGPKSPNGRGEGELARAGRADCLGDRRERTRPGWRRPERLGRGRPAPAIGGTPDDGPNASDVEALRPSPSVDRRPAPEPWRARSRSWSRGPSRRQAATGYGRAADPARSRAGNPPDRRGAARRQAWSSGEGAVGRVASRTASRPVSASTAAAPAIDLHPFESRRRGAPIWPPLPSRPPAPRPAGSGRGGKGAQLERARRARARQLALAAALPVAARDQPAVSRRVRASAGPAPTSAGRDRQGPRARH